MKTKISSVLRKTIFAGIFLVPICALTACHHKANDEDDNFKESTTDRLGVTPAKNKPDSSAADSLAK